MRNLKPLVWLSAIVLIVVVIVVTACTPKDSGSTGDTTGSTGTTYADGATSINLPDPNEYGVIPSDAYKDIYPDIYSTFMENQNNSDNPSYLDQYPFLKTLYSGNGFAKDYNEARGHTYTLTDVAATQRAHPTANCLTCKSPEMTALVQSKGISVYSMDFDEVYAMLQEPIGCYNCHANSGDGELVVSADYLLNALGSDINTINMDDAVCGQCHVTYYMDPDTKATTLPWSGLSSMDPDDMLAYYDSIGFSDFTNDISGAGMIKVRHPEMETVTGPGNLMQSMGGWNCSTCHMGTATNSDGVEYPNHYLQSPLQNADLISSTCSGCHTDLVSEVQTIQKNTIARFNTIGNKLADLHTKIGAAAANGMADDELAALRKDVRDAQFYFDFVFVENSDGAHNSALAKHCLDKAEQITDDALAQLAA